MHSVIVKDGVAKYVIEKGKKLDKLDKKIITEKFIIGDLNKHNCDIYNNVSDVPSDFKGDYYLYNGNNWTLNPDYQQNYIIEDEILNEKLTTFKNNKKRK